MGKYKIISHIINLSFLLTFKKSFIPIIEFVLSKISFINLKIIMAEAFANIVHW